MRYCSLQLYKLKLHFGNHKIKLQFAVNDGLPVDLENPQILWYIIHRLMKTIDNALGQGGGEGKVSLSMKHIQSATENTIAF